MVLWQKLKDIFSDILSFKLFKLHLTQIGEKENVIHGPFIKKFLQ